MKYCFVFFFLIIGYNHVVYAQTLEKTIQIVLKNNPAISASKTNETIAHEQLLKAHHPYKPKMDIRMSAGEQWIHHEFFDESLFRYDMELFIRQNIFNGFETTYSIQKNEAQLNYATNIKYETINKIVFNVISLYIELIRYKDLLDIAEDKVNLHERILNKIKTKAESGAGTQADVELVEWRLASSRAEWLSLSEKQKLTEIQLLSLTQTSSIQLSYPVPPSQLPLTIEIAIQIAEKNHSGLHAAKAYLAETIANGKIVESSFLPKLDFVLRGLIEHNVDGSEGTTNDYAAMLQMTMNVLNGGADLSQKRIAIQQIKHAQDNLQLVKTQLIESVSLAWHALESARKKYNHLKKLQSSAEKAREFASQQFKVSKIDLLDLLDIENQYMQSLSLLTTSQYEIDLCIFKLTAVTGTLKESFSNIF